MLPENMKIDDGLLECVSGGTEVKVNYSMEEDPLYNRFSDFWNGRKTEGVTGADSRTEFLDSFKKWVRDGMPENISKWYDGMNS